VIVFLHIPKTGGTTFRFILENSLGIFNCHAHQTRRDTFSQADFNFVRKLFPGLKSIAGHNLVDPLRLSFPNPFFMTFMREPIARVLSHYQDEVLRGNSRMTFEESVSTKEQLQNLHVRLMAGEANLDKAKRFLEKCGAVGITEKFDLSLHTVERLCPYKLDLHYRRRVVARDNATKEAVQRDSRMLELAREYNRLDLELYDFAVKEIFPKLCEKAGLNPSEKVSSYEILSDRIYARNQIGRFYNKVFRELYKLRSKVVRPS
jgi:hypothetical protein